MKPRVLLIDLSALFHPSWRASEHEPLSTAYESTIGGVGRAVGLMPEGTLVAICCDAPNNWRKAVSPDYKAKRDKLPDLFYKEFAKVKNDLFARGFLMLEYDTFEADDVIATATKEALERGHEVTIATPETLAEGILRRVGEMDSERRRAHSLLHDAERTIERMRSALTVIATESQHELSRDIARRAIEA